MRASAGVTFFVSAVALSTSVVSCYPDFQFGPESTSDGSTVSSSTGQTSLGPPCQVQGSRCAFGEACCFDKVAPPTDHCGTTCTSSFLELYCATDAQCSDNKKCCAVVDANGVLTSTSCRTSCTTADTKVACDPAISGTCGCKQILGGYYTDGKATTPYDQYGQCN